MRDFYITTDSDSDLPKEYIEKYNTTIIPQYYSFDDTIYGDELHMTPTDFYIRMRNGSLPQSHANDPVVIEEKFRAILDKGADIIHISFSSALSISYNNVCTVARALEKEYEGSRVTVVDSLNVSLGESLMVIYANRLKEQGTSYDEIIIWLNEFRHHINVQFTVDDLFHLQRGGRVSRTTALIGSAFNIKPFMYVTKNGTIAYAGNVRGRKKSITTLVDRMKSTLNDNIDYTLPVGVVHGNCYEDAKFLAKTIKSKTKYKTVIINDISPSIGAHSGPGALGLIYYGSIKPIE